MEEPEALKVIDWHEVGETAELKRTEKIGVTEDFQRLFELIKGNRVLLIEVEKGGALAAFNYFFENLIHGGAYVAPILGATTPYDLEAHKDKLGAKASAWVTSSIVDDKWIQELFNIIKPSNLFEITSFIKTISSKTGEQLVFVTDMFDEIYDLITEKEFHTLLSRLHTMLKGGNHSLVIVVQTSLYSKEYLALLERYADVKITYGDHIEAVNMRTNERETIK